MIMDIVIGIWLYLSSIAIIFVIDILLVALRVYLEIEEKRASNFANHCENALMLNLWISYLRIQMILLPMLFAISIVLMNYNKSTDLITMSFGIFTVFAYSSYNKILYIDKSGFYQNILYIICSAIVYSYLVTYNTTYMPTTSIIICIILLHLSFLISFIKNKYYFE